MKKHAGVPSGIVLGIETATALGGVALVAADGALLGEITLRSGESHAERVLPAAVSLLESHGLAPRDLAAVAVSCGPGSFTGLRAGIATAKGLAFALAVPLYGIPTLEALAANVAPCDGPVCAVLNARRGEVFRAWFRRGSLGPERLGEDGLLGAAALACELSPGCLVVGALPQGFAAPPGAAVRLAPAHLCHPRAAVIAGRGWEALGAARASDLDALLPRYLRPPDAEAARSRSKIACAGEELHVPSLTPPAPVR